MAKGADLNSIVEQGPECPVLDIGGSQGCSMIAGPYEDTLAFWRAMRPVKEVRDAVQRFWEKTTWSKPSFALHLRNWAPEQPDIYKKLSQAGGVGGQSYSRAAHLEAIALAVNLSKPNVLSQAKQKCQLPWDHPFNESYKMVGTTVNDVDALLGAYSLRLDTSDGTLRSAYSPPAEKPVEYPYPQKAPGPKWYLSSDSSTCVRAKRLGSSGRRLLLHDDTDAVDATGLSKICLLEEALRRYGAVSIEPSDWMPNFKEWMDGLDPRFVWKRYAYVVFDMWASSYAVSIKCGASRDGLRTYCSIDC